MAERIYECEVRKLFLRNGEKQRVWVTMGVAEAVQQGVTEFRCKDCHGRVRLHARRVAHGPAPHVEHRSKQDSEFCPAGFYFRQHPGRTPRHSLSPVE